MSEINAMLCYVVVRNFSFKNRRVKHKIKRMLNAVNL